MAMIKEFLSYRSHVIALVTLLIVSLGLTQIPLFNYLGYEFSALIVLFWSLAAGLLTISLWNKRQAQTSETFAAFSIRSLIIALLADHSFCRHRPERILRQELFVSPGHYPVSSRCGSRCRFCPRPLTLLRCRFSTPEENQLRDIMDRTACSDSLRRTDRAADLRIQSDPWLLPGPDLR